MITVPGYEIKPYKPDLACGVVDLLQDFWQADAETRRAYLRWKYEENPYAETPLALAAIFQGLIVGFRGYFATRWHVPGESLETIVLSPGDTFVHPDHRRSGLSVAMGKMAMTSYSEKYIIFLNLSATKPSVPGYLRMGFAPLALKSYMNRYSLAGLIRLVLGPSGGKTWEKRVTRPGQYGDIWVSDQPWVDDMRHVVSNSGIAVGKVALQQDRTFFGWRFLNRRNQYIFFYEKSKGLTTGYMVLRLTSGGRRGYVIDLAAPDIRSVDNMLHVVVRKGGCDIISIYEYSLNDDLRRVFKQHGFVVGGVMRMLEKKKRGEWPLLVRPVNPDYVEADWYYGGRDLRKMENWHIKEICSDGV